MPKELTHAKFMLQVLCILAIAVPLAWLLTALFLYAIIQLL